ncbi:MAG: hypothetical protein ACYDBQ_08485 [Thermoplasmatota archaeon]
MSAVMDVEFGLTAANGVLAVLLATVYARNHRDLRSPFTLGLLLFAAFLIVHSLFSVYVDATMMATYAPRAELLLVGESVLELFGLLALTWATWR